MFLAASAACCFLLLFVWPLIASPPCSVFSVSLSARHAPPRSLRMSAASRCSCVSDMRMCYKKKMVERERGRARASVLQHGEAGYHRLAELFCAKPTKRRPSNLTKSLGVHASPRTGVSLGGTGHAQEVRSEELFSNQTV
eukprot:4583605-Pleurochrysis_carterae.AAC.3